MKRETLNCDKSKAECLTIGKIMKEVSTGLMIDIASISSAA